MSYKALYRQWRPLVFEDVVEQEHVVKTLKYSVDTGKITHAYLFCGPRGTGKTTVAHILSRAINCISPRSGDPCNECEICKGILAGTILDVLEIDAASNNSVDNVRELRDDVVYSPSRARYKVYIIDEVHMLSTGAFNALLKTLEEPPAHVVFILATTEPHKLPATVVSRCQRFDFKRISVESIINHLEKIAGSNGVDFQKEALRLIARIAQGALRDAISLLDQCMSTGMSQISYDDVVSIIGIANEEFLSEMADSIISRDVGKTVELVEKLTASGKDILQFISDLIFYFRNMLLCKIVEKPEELMEVSSGVLDVMKKQCAQLSREEVIFAIKELSLLESTLKWATHQRIHLEIALIKLCERNFTFLDSDILDRLSMLEKKVSVMESESSLKHEDSLKQGMDTPAKNHEGEKPEEPSQAVTQQSNQSEPSQTPSSPVGPVQRVKTLEDWDKIINELKKNRKMKLFACLHGTSAVELDNGWLGIVFNQEKENIKSIILKHENLKIIEETVTRILGRQLRIKCIGESELAGLKGCNNKDEDDDLVLKAKHIAEIFKAPVDVIDG